MSLYRKLEQRNVFRVGPACLAQQKMPSGFFAIPILLFMVAGAVMAQGGSLLHGPLTAVVPLSEGDTWFRDGFEDLCTPNHCPKPEFPPFCVLEGTIHTLEGHDFHEIRSFFQRYNEIGSPLNQLNYFSPEPGIYHRSDSPDQETPWVPLLCGNYDLHFHSTDWAGCFNSPDEICFSNFAWWAGNGYDGPTREIAVPLAEGIEIPAAHISGLVVDSEELAIEGIALTARYNQNIFNFARNDTSSDASGHYDIVVLHNRTWTVSASLPDDHPRINDLWVPEEIDLIMAEANIVANITMPDGPERCPLSGQVSTSGGVALERIEFIHFSPWYGQFGWAFRSDEPGFYYRKGTETPILESIPLVCGVQDLLLSSRASSSFPSCYDPERFDQPCFSNFFLWQSHDLSAPEHGFELEVVTLSGLITINSDTPVDGAEIVVTGTIYSDDGGNLDPMGVVSNYALSGTDGTYELVLLPTDLSPYEIRVTTPPHVNLGGITSIKTINEDTVLDFDFTEEL